MKYKTLGDTGLLVSTLCFGAMTFHGGSGLLGAAVKEKFAAAQK